MARGCLDFRYPRKSGRGTGSTRATWFDPKRSSGCRRVPWEPASVSLNVAHALSRHDLGFTCPGHYHGHHWPGPVGVWAVGPRAVDPVVGERSPVRSVCAASQVRIARKALISGAGDLISTTTDSSIASNPCRTPFGWRQTSPGPIMNSSEPTVDLTLPFTT